MKWDVVQRKVCWRVVDACCRKPVTASTASTEARHRSWARNLKGQMRLAAVPTLGAFWALPRGPQLH